jgi:hypothetical protein
MLGVNTGTNQSTGDYRNTLLQTGCVVLDTERRIVEEIKVLQKKWEK